MVSLTPFAEEDPNHFLLFTFIKSRADRENFDHIDNSNGAVLKDAERPWFFNRESVERNARPIRG